MTRLPTLIIVITLLVLCVLLHIACDQSQQTPPVSEVQSTRVTTSPPLGDYYRTGPVSIEESIVWSDVVARVRMRSATGTVEYGPSGPRQR